MVVNKKLGKGLSSLLGNKEVFQKTSDQKGLLLIPIEKIFRDDAQPRKEFDKEKILKIIIEKKAIARAKATSVKGLLFS